jgi:hypothetical protein
MKYKVYVEYVGSFITTVEAETQDKAAKEALIECELSRDEGELDYAVVNVDVRPAKK